MGSKQLFGDLHILLVNGCCFTLGRLLVFQPRESNNPLSELRECGWSNENIEA